MFRKVLKGSAFLLGAQILTKVIAFFYSALFLPRVLGVDNFGVYIVALSYFSFISSVADFGMSSFLIREVSKTADNLENMVANVFILRLTILSVIYAAVALSLAYFDPDHMRADLTILAIGGVVPQGIAMTLDNTFIALSNFFLSALGIVVLGVSTALIGVLLVNSGMGVLGAVLAVIAGELFYAIFMSITFFKKRIPFKGIISSTYVKSVIFNSLPYGIIGILGLIFFKIDSVLLVYIRGSFETGIYGVAYKFIEALTFIPATIGLVLFPSLAKTHQQGIAGIRKATGRIFAVMGITGILTAVGFFLVTPKFIELFLPKYILSVDAVRILSLTIPFMFVHVTLAQILLSSERYVKPVVAISFLTVAFNIFLNLLLIPAYGFIGASWVTVASDIFSLGVLLAVFKRYLFR